MKFAVRHMLKLAVSAASAILVSAAAPALANTANSAATTTSADVTQPLREGQPEVVDTGDARFKSLFSSWTALERTSPTLGRPAISSCCCCR